MAVGARVTSCGIFVKGLRCGGVAGPGRFVLRSEEVGSERSSSWFDPIKRLLLIVRADDAFAFRCVGGFGCRVLIVSVIDQT